MPLLTDALASLECSIVAEHPTGDHWIVVGQAHNLHISPNQDPLVFFAGEFGALHQREAAGCGPARAGAQLPR